MTTYEPKRWAGVLIALIVLSGGPLGCGDDDETSNPDEFEQLDISVCDPANGPFTVAIDNEYFPLAVGTELLLEGIDDEGVAIAVELEVLDDTELIAGVTARVVEVREYEDEELIEISHDFYAQAPDGTVCYLGEDVDEYEDGEIVGHGGQWRAGEAGNAPGILMPGDPRVGTKFLQESAPGIAEDMSAIMALTEAIDVPAGHFEGCLWAIDWNPLEGDTSADAEDKFYIRGIGLAVDDVTQLVEYEIAP